MVNPAEDQNLRELSYANQKEETPRGPLSEERLGEEESAAIAARTAAGVEHDMQPNFGIPEKKKEPRRRPMAEINSVNYVNDDEKDIDSSLDADMPGEGGVTDDDKLKEQARGSDTPAQDLEIEGDTTQEAGVHKRQSIEGDLGDSDVNRHVA